MKSFTVLQISVRIIAVTAGRSTSTKVDLGLLTAAWAESWKKDYLAYQGRRGEHHDYARGPGIVRF